MGQVPQDMLAVRYDGAGGAEVVRTAREPVPVPGPGEVLVAVAAAGLNRADLVQRAGDYPVPPGASEIPGLEVSGTVTPKGDLVKNVSRAYGWKYVHQVSWAVNQKVGPYTLEPGTWGRLVWGFTMLDGDAQDVKCSPQQTWEAVGKPYTFTVPEARYSELRVENPQL